MSIACCSLAISLSDSLHHFEPTGAPPAMPPTATADGAAGLLDVVGHSNLAAGVTRSTKVAAGQQVKNRALGSKRELLDGPRLKAARVSPVRAPRLEPGC